MNNSTTTYDKRIQKDYSLSFKHQIVQQIENREFTTTQAVKQYAIQARSIVTSWVRKYGNFEWHIKHPMRCPDKNTTTEAFGTGANGAAPFSQIKNNHF
jgi:transposase-like protein